MDAERKACLRARQHQHSTAFWPRHRHPQDPGVGGHTNGRGSQATTVECTEEPCIQRAGRSAEPAPHTRRHPGAAAASSAAGTATREAWAACCAASAACTTRPYVEAAAASAASAASAAQAGGKPAQVDGRAVQAVAQSLHHAPTVTATGAASCGGATQAHRSGQRFPGVWQCRGRPCRTLAECGANDTGCVASTAGHTGCTCRSRRCSWEPSTQRACSHAWH